MKTPLLIIPGLVCDARLFGHQIDHLSDLADIEVVDHRHHDSIKKLARDVLDDAPDEFALCALSMGGYVAFEIMRQAPERVTKLALIATSARLDTDEVAARRRGFIKLAGLGKFKGMSGALMRSFIHPDNVGNPHIVSTLYDMAEDTGSQGFINQQTMILGRPESLETLKGINCPTMVIFGDRDERTPLEINREIADGIKGAELVVISSCGHLPPLEKPQETTEHLRRWLLEF